MKMKYNKLTTLRGMVSAVMILLAIGWTGCTKNFEHRNTNPSGLESLTPEEVKALFPTAVYNGWNIAYQTGQNLLAGMYSQYFFCTQPAFGTHRYVMNQQWLTSTWNGLYVSTIPALMNIIKESSDLPAINAQARIWKVFMLNRYTDYFGPIPYSQIGNFIEGEGVAYDAQKDIYYDFFKELDEATTALKNNLSAPSFGDQDLIYNGDNAKWLKFANSLRLRLAMRISLVEPAKAKTEAEAAFAGGVLENTVDNANVVSTAAKFNGLNRISAWNEFRMSALFESLFKGYNDPRMAIYFEPAKNDGVFRGGRSGLSQGEMALGFNTYDNTSNVSARFQPIQQDTNPMAVMYAAEVYFLRAEGVLNGWNVGGGLTAEQLYNKAIETSLKQWGVTDQGIIDSYINGTSLPIAPAPENGWNTPPASNIPVKFSSDPEKQREQIGTQKWLALFPSEMEAWAEMRRTGYPKMYPLIHSDNPDLSKDQMIRRIGFVDIDRQANGPSVKAAEALLGPGGDKVSTRLWWDVKQ
jgi:hypothetical protein